MRSRALPGLASLALAHALIAASASASDGVLKGPYLQHLTSASVDIRVELAASEALAVFLTADAGDGGHAPPPRTFASPAATLHSVHLTGLAPSTRYHYAVDVGGRSAKSPAGGVFVTAPADASHAPFTFVLYGDNRSDGPTHARVVEAIEKETFDFLVQTGDMVIAGADEPAWQEFFDIEEPMLRDQCVFAAIGNHELHSDRTAAHFERYFGPTEVPAASGPAPLYGSFRWGRARFFLLNAFEDWGPGKERAWLEQALTLADHEAGIDLRVAVVHQGPYSAGPHHGNAQMLDAHVDDLLVAHHVDLLVAGHDHIYERGQAGALKYLISGGGGAPLYRDITPVASTRKAEATYHYVLVTVSDAGVAILAKRPDGSIVDTCSFARGGGWLCDPPKPEVAIDRAATPGPTVASEPRGGMCGCDVPGGSFPSGLPALVSGGMIVATVRRRKRR